MDLSPSALSLLKPYLVTKLECLSSEADCDVLADYLLELIKSEGSEADVIRNTKEQLVDFLPGDSGKFVDEVFQAIRDGSYDPSRAAAAAAKQAHVGGGYAVHGGRGNGYGQEQGKRKRDADQDEEMGDAERYGSYGNGGRGGRKRGDRGVKAPRRGREDYGGRGEYGQGRGGYRPDPRAQGFVPQGNQQGYGAAQQLQGQQPQMPFGFDPNNPMAMLQAMQQAMGMMQGAPNFGGGQQRKTGKRCRDYDNKGVCTRGANCPYDHGDDFEEYDPSGSGDRGYEQRGRGRGRGRGERGGARGGRGNRAPFSSPAPAHGRDTKAIVVENIPPESFSEESVRGFFAEFGTIDGVELQEGRRLAIITYSDHDGAQRAFESPRVVFDNRFVKVYWYRPESLDRQNGYGPRGGRGGRGRGGMNGEGRTGADGDVAMEETEQEEQIDPDVFRKQQEAAQQRFEELKAAKTKREELEAKMKAQAEERAELMRKLAAKTKGKSPAVDDSAQANGADVHGIGVGAGAAATQVQENGDKKATQTDALKAKLAALEAEARSIGINPDSTATTSYQDFAPRGRGRGFVPRGGYSRGGFTPRGAWRGRGRGMPYGGMQGGAVKRLDNRPRGFTVSFEGGKKYDEMHEGLNQYLLFSDQIQSAKVSKHLTKDDVALVMFAERYKAEMFLGAVQTAKNELPHVGKVEIAWVPNAEVPAESFPDGGQAGTSGESSVVGTWSGNASAGGDDAMEDVGGEQGEANGDGNGESAAHESGQGPMEMNYDVADDDDRWLAD
ncbi:hypothetical protein B9Z65_5974 [Elsinoe australis]|uniref:Uncharacterized protein n=1 Tax=Elsinoe australis TaxID=40998 RepID=A0A2P7YJL8_9PEZI|nr:hypothetical protein B9Z65_5974 [Elsinoe australis]